MLTRDSAGDYVPAATQRQTELLLCVRPARVPFLSALCPILPRAQSSFSLPHPHGKVIL